MSLPFVKSSESNSKTKHVLLSKEVFKMTIVEKAAYLKGLVEGLGVEPESRDGKLWGTLCDLVSDMAHEIEDLQMENLDFAEELDDMSEAVDSLEDVVYDLDSPYDVEDEDDDGDYSGCGCGCCGRCDEDDYDDYDDYDDEDDSEEDDEYDDDEELEYDGVMYDVICPGCEEEICFDEETLDRGYIICPNCGEKLEFELGDEDDSDEDDDGDDTQE